MIETELKDAREFKMIYDWLQITRRPTQNLGADIKMVMDLIKVPITEDEISFLINIIDPNHQKQKLTEADFISCFLPSEESKKCKERKLEKAFRGLSKNSDHISFDILKECLEKQELNEFTVELVLKQMAEWESDDKKFDYKGFLANDF